VLKKLAADSTRAANKRSHTFWTIAGATRLERGVDLFRSRSFSEIENTSVAISVASYDSGLTE